MKRDSLAASILMLFILCLGISAQDFSGSLESGLGSWLQSDEILPPALVFEGAVEGLVGDPDSPSGRYLARVRLDSGPALSATSMALREAWITAYLGPVDLTVGNQVVAWGVTDAFTPVDVVNPQDRSLPVDAEKLPVPMGRVFLNGNNFTLDLVALPAWTASVLPAARWQTAQAGFSPPTGVVVDSRSLVTNSPETTWENAQYGGRLAGTLGVFQGLDLGLTCFRGVATTPTLSYTPTAVGPGHVTVQVDLNYERYYLLGLDAVLALDGGLLLKAEGGYTPFNDTSWLDPAAGEARAEGVAGLEYTLFGVKSIGEFVLDWEKGPAGADDAWTKTLVLILNAEPTSRLSLKAFGGWNLDGSGMLSPQVAYTLADGLEASGKAFVFFGEDDTRYGAWQDNALFQASLKYSF